MADSGRGSAPRGGFGRGRGNYFQFCICKDLTRSQDEAIVEEVEEDAVDVDVEEMIRRTNGFQLRSLDV